VLLGDVLDHGVVLGRLALVDDVGLVEATGIAVGGDLDDAEVVGLAELRGLVAAVPVMPPSLP
jgi:hypothetical protein